MRFANLVARLAASAGLLALAACGGGSGSGTTTISVGALSAPSLNGNSPVMASGAGTPSFTSTTNAPPAGTVFPLDESVVATTTKSVAAYTPNGGATLTLTGTFTDSNGITQGIYEVKIPSLNVDVTGVEANQGAGNVGDGRGITLSTVTMNYTLIGIWGVNPSTASGTVYTGYGVTGYQTPAGSLPTTGTATYTGTSGSNGGVVGVAFNASGGMLNSATVAGNASINVNFATGAVNGSLTNMIVASTTPQTFNNVSLTGSLSGSAISGTTGVTSTPSGSFAMGSNASGTFGGALYGPNGEELGAVWNLHDTNKSAIGVIGAAR